MILTVVVLVSVQDVQGCAKWGTHFQFTRLEAWLRSSCKNEMTPAPEPTVFVSMAPAPELWFFYNMDSAPLRLQLCLLIHFNNFGIPSVLLVNVLFQHILN